MMNQNDLIIKIKQVPITDYLASRQIQPYKSAGHQFLYFSPLQEENTPSFYVHPQKNVFNDFSSGEKGDVIRIVMLLNNCSFQGAIKILEDFSHIQHNSSFTDPPTPQPEIQIKKIRKLQNEALFQYLRDRKIDTQIASIYLHEAYFVTHSQSYFALCFKNDSGGYELRNKYFKGTISPKYSRLIEVAGSKQLNIFEGFTDFLSALMYYKIEQPSHNTLILNSLLFLNQVLPQLHTYQKVNVFLDNDTAGKKAFQKIRDVHPNVRDYSCIYHPYKDFNEFLMATQ